MLTDDSLEYKERLILCPFSDKAFSRNIELHYQVCSTRFGTAIVVTNEEGVCYLAFAENISEELHKINKLFPGAIITDKKTRI